MNDRERFLEYLRSIGMAGMEIAPGTNVRRMPEFRYGLGERGVYVGTEHAACGFLFDAEGKFRSVEMYS